MNINIQDFLEPEPLHEWQRAPFNLGSRTVATTPWAIISIPKDDQYEPLESHMENAVQAQLDKIKNHKFKPMPAIEMPELIDCTLCDSTGTTHIARCSECHGAGYVEFATTFNDYNPACLTCKGQCMEILPGGDETCQLCRGKGASFNEKTPIEIEGVHVNPNLLLPISSAPNLQIATDKETHMLFFKASDAEGVIAGMKL